MTSEKFRYQLRQEAQKWQNEGLISSDIYEELSVRYKLEELDMYAGNRFIVIVLGIGFILLGLGVITFVAANWQVWSRTFRVLLLLSFLTATNSVGFFWWKSENESKSRIGQGLLLLGALSLGANLGLMSQMFHQTGSIYTLFFIWGLGVCGMAYGLRLTSLGLMAIILMAIAYFQGILYDNVWSVTDLGVLLQQMPIVVSLLFIPLAYYCRSRWIFGLSLALIVFSLGRKITGYLDVAHLSKTSIMPALVFILIPSLLWSYRDRLLFPNSDVKFDSISRKLAIFYLGSLFYFCSFGFWEYYLSTSRSGKFIDLTAISSLIPLTIFTIFSIWAWWELGTRRSNDLPWRLDRNSIYVGTTLLFLFCLIWFNFAVTPIGIAGTIIFNLLLFSLAIILINQSVKEGRRFNFWFGILLAILQILSRMFEYNTDLILKAIVLFICGIAAIMAGLWFERNLNRQNFLNSQD